MMVRTFGNIISIVLCATYSASGAVDLTSNDVKGYYWRDYYGEIPDDAFPGGKDLHGNPIYIGQTFDRFLIPSQINYLTKKAYHEYDGKECEGIIVKILCTQHPKQLQWIPTDNIAINQLTDVQLIIGGYEHGFSSYIGKVGYNKEVLVGKVFIDNIPDYAGLWTTLNGNGLHFTKFDVLLFNPNILDIDVRF